MRRVVLVFACAVVSASAFVPRALERQATLTAPRKPLVLRSSEESFGPPALVGDWTYADFAKAYPFQNNLIIATLKTASADLVAQTVLEHHALADVDLQRSLLFCLFGLAYLGGFQYLYSVNIFKKIFTDMERFTDQPLGDKLSDGPGLRSLAGQIALDMVTLTFVYLPVFYIFRAGVFSGSGDPLEWATTGLGNYVANAPNDEIDVYRVWLPADVVCFSVPLYLRLPVRHFVSFFWTAYLSFTRGGMH